MSYQVKVEKMIQRSTSDVFRSLKEGKLFLNCGCLSNTMQMDFRVGGKYQIEFHNQTKINFGEFLEIVPDKKIVFSWCQTFGPEQKPDTQVTIELFADGAKTRLVLVHTGFKNKEVCDAHKQGWEGGLTDFTEEIVNGRLRMVRKFSLSAEKVFELCKNPETFFALIGDINKGTFDIKVGGKIQMPTKNNEVKGEYLEIIPGKKLAFSWLRGATGPLNSRVTLNFHPKEDGSALELIHEGLNTEQEQLAHRQGWDFVTKKLMN